MLRRSFSLLVLLLFTPIIGGSNRQSLAQVPDQTFSVGVASVDITPEYPVRLNGFGSRRTEAEGVSQTLWAKALAINHGDQPPFVILAVDNLGVRQPMVDQVAAALHDKYQIPREQVALTFTHTHCAPKVNGASDTIFSSPIPAEHQLHIDRYTEELPKLLIQVASQAIENRQPATLEWQIGKVTFAANRRTADGPVDHDLPVMLARDLNGKPFAVYTSYACHCVTLSFNWYSGDWAGYAQEAIEESFPGTTALVSIGCGSDSNPVSGVTNDRIEAAKDYGKQIADEAIRLFETPGRPIRGPVSASRDLIPLALNDLPTREALEALAKEGGPAGFNAKWQLAKLDRGESLTSELQYPVQSFTFGDDLHMVFLAGEVCVDYSNRLKKELNRDHLWVNGYSNDFCAYIPSERLLNEGGYGGGGEIPYFALPATLKGGLEQQIIDAVKRRTPQVFHLPDGTQGVPPKSPEESLRLMETHDELHIELVAAEPLVTDPVAIDFGSDGRLWVAEMADYSRGVDENFEPHGRIRFLVDTDRDGVFDQSTVFLDDLRFPTDVKVWRDGVLICDAPDVIFAADRDGDGRAEVREVILSGFATHNPHARVNSLRFGWDGWVYGSGGLFGGQISSKSSTNVDTANRDFRFNPDSGVVESATGQTQQGRTRDDFGNWFGCTNSALLLHYPLEERYAARLPEIVPPPTIVSVPSEAHGQQLFPPANLVLFKLTGAPGRPTSACGAEIYRDQLLGAEYYGDAFVCEPVNQLVHRMELSRDNQGRIVGNRAENEIGSEFLRSTDQWFRPVQVRTGTDGAIYVVDMYRYVIEHSQWIPEEARAELNLLAGQDRGRIYRITRRDQATTSLPNLAEKSPRQLADLMRSSNGPIRDLVQQELLWRNDRDSEVDSGLSEVAREADWPAARIQAIATLASRGRLPVDLLFRELETSHREAQRAFVQISEGLLASSPRLRSAIRDLATNATPEVDIQIAFSVADIPATERVDLLTRFVDAPCGPWLAYAVLTSLQPDDVPLLWANLDRPDSQPPLSFFRSLIKLAAIDQNVNMQIINQILAADSDFVLANRWQLLSEWLRASSSVEFVELSTVHERIYDQADLALLAVQDESTEDDTRIAALELVTELGRPAARAYRRELSPPQLDSVSALLAIQFSPDVQSAALRALAALPAENNRPRFLDGWETASPGLRVKMVDLILTRPDWIHHLLQFVVDRQISPREFNATQRDRLTTQTDPELLELAQRAFATLATSTRSEVLEQWHDVFQLDASIEAGRAVFAKHCAACHLLDGAGVSVGPDLAALTRRTPESMFVAILDPNRDIDTRYLNYVALTSSGHTVSGLLTEETAVSVTLKEREGKTQVLLRSELEELRSGSKSAMPEGVENDLSHQDLADLIAYLVPPRIPPKSFVGNQPELVRADGDGVIELHAAQAEIYGTDIIFESNSPFRNIGYWHGEQDRAAWNLECEAAGQFDIYLDYACPTDSAGNHFSVNVGRSELSGVVESTGAWSEYRWIKAGSVELVEEVNYLTVGYGGRKQAAALFDLRRIVVTPKGREPPQ